MEQVALERVALREHLKRLTSGGHQWWDRGGLAGVKREKRALKRGADRVSTDDAVVYTARLQFGGVLWRRNGRNRQAVRVVPWQR
jgi:hypothetical protein